MLQHLGMKITKPVIFNLFKDKDAFMDRQPEQGNSSYKIECYLNPCLW